MAIQSQLRRSDIYVGDGVQTQFSFAFKLLKPDDAEVHVAPPDGIDAVLDHNAYVCVLNDDQDVNPGGTVTLKEPLAKGASLVIISGAAYVQPTVFTNRGAFFPKVLNDSLDRETILIQQLVEQVSRALITDPTDTITPRQLRDKLLAAAASALDAAAKALQSETNAAASAATSKEYADKLLAFKDQIVTVSDNIKSVGITAENAEAITEIAKNLEELLKSKDYAAEAKGWAEKANAITGGQAIIATGTTTPRTLLERFADYVNVKNFGARGDGISDDTAAIQAAIDKYPHGEVRFPRGTYMVSQTILTDADDSKTQKLTLDHGAVLKAASDFSGDWLVILGGRGTGGSNMSTSMHPPGFEGGHLDCSGLCNGLLSLHTHMARIHDFDVINAKTIGVQVDGAQTNGSADAYVYNVNAYRANGRSSAEDSVGFFINAMDCDIRDIRCGGFRTGVRALRGGYISNAHPIYGTMDSNYNLSVGFDIQGAYLVSCYSDNFSTALVQNKNINWAAENFIAYWYTNTDHKHTLFKIVGADIFTGLVRGVKVTYPANGENVGIALDAPDGLSRYQQSNLHYRGITGLHMTEADWSRMTYRDTDLLFDNQILGISSYALGNSTGERIFETGKYYPLCIFRPREERLQLTVNFQNLVMFELRATVNDNGLKLERCQTFKNAIGAQITLAAKKQVVNSMNIFKVYFKIESMVSDNTLKTLDVSFNNQTMQGFYLIPLRAAHNYDDDYKGLDSVEATGATLALPLGEGIQTTTAPTFVKITTNSTTHSIPARPGFTRCWVHYGTNVAEFLLYSQSVYRFHPTSGLPEGLSVTYNSDMKQWDFVLPEAGVIFYESF